MQIRQLTEKDAEDYFVLRIRALREHPEAFAKSPEEVEELGISRLAEQFKEGRTVTFGSFSGSTLTGMATLIPDYRPKTKHKGWLTGMYVIPECRNEGIGTQLVERVLEEAAVRGMKYVHLTSAEKNHAAESLYSQMGFRRWGKEPASLWVNGNWVDEVHYVREIE
ncbi:GNAT family N-acetyltransferase [Alkalicoccus urumqiensis]|uniref:GNAT family N-acetyltransferase n=1 Tax=Alkalicoccus urumqiensis TaxID=1548213 RepID=A0A2P6MLB1_ALKUR|nr:GNAT family N-acetyltransferase [Alkalicoccus urumqiensis]PRO67077.1 GNAT family N-acetyltransferase [Alkalicoccus urumqiensis]